MVANLAQRLGFPEHQCGQLSLAVDEALCNIIKHGYDRSPEGLIWMSIWMLEADEEKPAGIRIILEDNARQVESDTIQSRDLDDIRPGGLGVFIIREVMDEVTYEKREEGGMRLSMMKRIAPTPEGTKVPEDTLPAALRKQ